MKHLAPLNPLTFFCPNGIDAAADCRCPKIEIVETERIITKNVVYIAFGVLVFALLLAFGPEVMN